MPPDGIINVEFLNQNSQRAYPLSDEAGKLDVTGTFTLPDSFLVELYFPVHAGVDVEPEKFFLRRVGVFATGFNIVLAYDDGTSTPPLVASANIPRSAFSANESFALPGAGGFTDSVGKVVIGSLDEIDRQPSGVFTFDFDGGRLDTDVIRPQIRGLQSITLVNNSEKSDPIAGDVELIAGNNIRLTPVVVSGQDPQIVISAIEGEGLNEDCICDEELAPPIRTLNGVPPDTSGNFTLLGNDCINIQPIANGLSLDDVCSAPCCGCEELEAVNSQIARFGDGFVTLQTFVNRLAREVSAMSLTVLGSRLGDKGCFEC